MESVFRAAERASGAALRLSLGIVLAWIGALKFVDPTPVVGLLEASFSFLALPGFVYLLGALELVAAALLLAGIAERWAGLLCVGLFSGTLVIFAIAPMVSFGAAGFPSLTLAGQFLLKDLALMAVSIAVAGGAAATERSAGTALAGGPARQGALR